MRRAALLAALALAAGCQIDSRTDEYRCDAPADCTGGRTCVGGYCVLDGDGGTLDAQPDAGPDAFACPDACDDCTGGTCIIQCDTTSSCNGDIVCPTGMPCEIHCTGNGSCNGSITCGADACSVECSGSNTCGGGGVDCTASCACDVTCTGINSCLNHANCPGPPSCDTGAGCQSGPTACHSC